MIHVDGEKEIFQIEGNALNLLEDISQIIYTPRCHGFPERLLFDAAMSGLTHPCDIDKSEDNISENAKAETEVMEELGRIIGKIMSKDEDKNARNFENIFGDLFKNQEE